MEKFSLDLFVTVFVLIVLACHLLRGGDQFRFIVLLRSIYTLVSIHTRDLLCVNYFANFSVHTIPKNGYTTHY